MSGLSYQLLFISPAVGVLRLETGVAKKEMKVLTVFGQPELRCGLRINN
jgi:hypothetical protein